MSAVGNALDVRDRSAPRLRSLVRGRAEDAAWVRPALLTLLACTAVLYLAGLAANGWANAFYSAAVQASTKSWKAFFFGSSDAANFITGAVVVCDGGQSLAGLGVSMMAAMRPRS